MAFGLDGLKDFNETLNSLADQTNISENSANERNDKLCKSIVYLASAIVLYSMSEFDDVDDDLIELLAHLHNFAKELNS